jgi:DNA repair protein RadC
MQHRDGSSSYNVMIREMAPDDRPRERLRQLGASALSTSELIAILLNTGIKGESVTTMSQRMLRDHDGLAGLMKMDVVELAAIKGLGEAKAAKLKAALEIGRRVSVLRNDDKPRVGSPDDIAGLLSMEMMMLDQEELRVVLLDTKHHILSVSNVYRGTVNAVNVRIAEIFKPAIRHGATAIALVHNHPSGDPAPSTADIKMTRDAVAAGNMLDITVVDHVIIGRGAYVSLKRLGLGFDGG